MELIITLIGLAKSLPTLASHYKKIKAQLNLSTVHEDLLDRSMKAAIKKVTGKDVTELRLKEEVAIYKTAIEYFDNPHNDSELKRLFYLSHDNIKDIEKQFLINLSENGGLEIITYLLTQLFPKVNRIEAGVERIEEGVSLNKLKLEQIKSSIGILPDFLNNINKILEPQLTKQEEKYKLEDKTDFFDAPTIPNTFIKRTETLSNLKKLFTNPIILVYGVTRSGKSFLISELINGENLDHFWYDFKLNETNGDSFFYLQLIKYILQNDPISNINKYVEGGNFNFQAIADTISKISNSKKGFCTVLDNIHLSKHTEQLDSFLKLLIDKANNKIRIFLISEEKDIGKTFPSNINNIGEFQSSGFSTREMKDFFKKNEISTQGVSNNFLEMIHYNSNQGHPDIIYGLVLELKEKGVKNLISKEVINQVLKSFKDFPAQQKIMRVLSEKIFSNILKTENQKNLFIRLSCLIGIFTKDLANFVSLIDPSIKNFHLIFPTISEKLFDVYPDSKYSIPKIFKETSNIYLTDKIKNEVYINAANYLSAPQKGILNFNNGELACSYLLLAGQINAALTFATKLLRRILIKYDNNEYIRKALDKFDIYVELRILDTYLNEQVEYLVVTLEAYKKIGDNDKSLEIAEKIYETLTLPQLKDKLKLFACSSLLFFYIRAKQKNIEKILYCAYYFIRGINEDYFPNELKGTDRKSFLQALIIYILNRDDPNIDDLNKFIGFCIEKDISVDSIFDKEFLVEFFEILWSVLYKAINSSEETNKTLVNVITKLDTTNSILKKINFNLGLRETNYLIGLLQTDFAENPLEAIQYLNESKGNNDNLEKGGNEFLSKNYLAIGDAYYKAEKYDLALENYIIAENYFNEINGKSSLKIHNYVRIGICYYELGDKLSAEKYLWKAFRTSRNDNESPIENTFMALSELSTYYLKTEEYLKSLKCFSIILELISKIEYSAKDQLVGQSLNWLKKSIDEKNPNLDTYMVGDKKFYKPFWGMYRNPTYVDPRATKLTTLLLLAEGFMSIKKHNKARDIYRRIILSPDCKEFDVMAKYLSVVNFTNNSILCDNFNELTFCFENIFEVLSQYNNIISRTIPNIPRNDIIGAVYYTFINPIKNKYVRKYGDVGQLIEVEKFFLQLVKITKSLNTEFSNSLLAEIASAFGWFYGLNLQLNTSYRETSLSWLTKSNEIALPNGRIETFINNKNLELFYIPIITDLKKYLRDVFEYMFFIKDYIENLDIISPTLSAFSNLVMGIHKEHILKTELDILEDFRNTFRAFLSNTENHRNNFILIVQCFLKNRLNLNLNKEKTIIFYQFLFDNVSNISNSELDNLFNNYFSVQKDIIRKNISDNDYVKKWNEEMKNNLEKFLSTKSNHISKLLKQQIESKIVELTYTGR